MIRPLAIILAVTAGLAGCGRHQAAAPSSGTPPAVQVSVARVESAAGPRFLAVAGTVRPVNRATLAARIQGTLLEAPPPLGARVSGGQVLVTLSAGEFEARFDRAAAVLTQLERELAMAQRLSSQGAAAEEEVRLLGDRRRAAAAALAEAQALLSYTRIAAPFDGVVTGRHAEAGDLASPGSPLLVVEDTGRLRAEVQVPESLATPDPGTVLEVAFDGAVVRGTLAEISPSADPASRTRLAKVDLPADSGTRPGQFVRVLWPAGREEFLRVPTDAVSPFGQVERVFVADSGKARLRIVRTGGAVGGSTRILAGLDAGEIVVRTPPAGLRDGQALEIRP